MAALGSLGRKSSRRKRVNGGDVARFIHSCVLYVSSLTAIISYRIMYTPPTCTRIPLSFLIFNKSSEYCNRANTRVRGIDDAIVYRVLHDQTVTNTS